MKVPSKKVGESMLRLAANEVAETTPSTYHTQVAGGEPRMADEILPDSPNLPKITTLRELADAVQGLVDSSGKHVYAEDLQDGLDRVADPDWRELRVGDFVILGERQVRVCGMRDGVTVCRDDRKRIAVRNVSTNRLSYVPEWRLLKARRE